MWLWMLIVNSVLSQMLTEKQLNNTEVPYLLTDISMQCPEGWEIEGNKCYRLYPTEKSWPQALIFCGRGRGEFAKKRNVVKAKHLQDLLQQTSQQRGTLRCKNWHESNRKKENTFVSRLISRPHRSATIARSAHWIGLAVGERGAAADGDDARFLWSDGSAASRYIGRWARNQPRFSDGRCTIAGLDGRTELEWQLAMCNRLLPFVCELPACDHFSVTTENASQKVLTAMELTNVMISVMNSIAQLLTLMQIVFVTNEANRGKIETPNFPSSYRSNLNCRWVLEGPVNSRLTLTFDTFETEENADLVTILDGGPAENSTLVIDTLSGSPASSQLSVTSSTNMLIVRFRSDATVQARGFQATWRANTFSCGGALKAQMYSQTFSSPRPYPAVCGKKVHDYNDGGECAWRIESTPGQVISLNIETFDIEAKKDFLIIYDGAQPSSPNHLYIYFYSNYAHAAKGFTISYKKGCDNTIQYTHGALLSPGHMSVPYPNVQTCKYTIELPENKAAQPIAIAINHFDVEEDDFLKIYEGDESGRALHEGQGFSEHRRPPKRVYSQQGKATIVFNSNALKNALGWNLTFSTNCPTLKAPNNVFFSSQNTAFGTKVVVTCKPGHEFTNGIGQRFEMICELGGRWTEDFIPQCQPIYCGAVPQIANGFAVSATNVTFGGMAKYECYDGFSFPSGKKSEEVRCGDDGWSKPPKCKAESCSALPQFQNGKRSLRFGDGNGFGTVYQFACDDGFRLVGAPTILCRSNGDWSAEQPNCKKLICPIIPAVKNGRIVVSGGRLEFGDTARVECSVGFRITGPEVVHCLANQTLSSISECRDLDECVEDLAICTAKSTSCVNLEGGYACQCLNGFKPQLNCPSYVSLTPVKVETTSSHIANLTHLTYCADPTDTERQVTFTFAAPKVLERIRFEKLNGGMPMIISISYANDTRGRFHTNANLTKIEMKNVDVAGSQVVVLREAVEIQMLQITIHEFKQNPCTKIELLGCQKSSCIDVNECETENGFCDHNCHNFQGGYKCSCNEGYNLFAVDGQGGVSLKDGETGLSNLDTVRFNKTCIPTRCPPISSPENGQIVSAIGDFQFPTVLEFKCRFGYQIRGPRFLKSAVCEGIQNNTAIGMFVSSSSTFVPYGENVTFVCTQQNRPARSSPLGNVRQCIYDPQPNGVDYSLAGPIADCPLVDCGPPPAEPGAFYEGEENNFKVGSAFGFNCRPPYSLIGKSSYDDRIVRCNVDGSFDLGDLRCSGPVCVDPGNPDEGRTYLNSVEEGAIARFTCNRPGYRPFPHDTINCTLGTPCLLSEDVGISTGFIPDGAFTDSDTKTTYGYEPHKARLSSTGWCGSKDAFIFLSVDLQRIYTLTTLRFAGVAGSGHLKGHVTKLQLFYKVQFSQNYDSYPIEFETEPGNHNRLYQFQLNPPVRARYILLGVTEYEDNPCLRFDMFGCLAPLSSAHEIPSHLQVGWNASVPQCIDAEPPIFKNCPINPIFAQIDEFGQLLPVSYEIPFAVDNSGSIAHIRVEPKDFRPPYPIHEPIDVHYTAFDNAGNSAECVVQLRVPDTQPPAMKCPDSYAIHAKPNETERHVNFNETSVNLVIHDASNVTEIRIRPSDATIRLHSHVDVEVTATDVHSNQNSCKFQVALTPEPCAEWALRTDDSTVIKKCVKRAKGTACTLKCKPGYRFVNGSSVEPSELQFTCSGDNSWLPNANPPDCVAVAQEPARYELNVAIDYTSTVMPSVECMKSYGESVSSHFDSIGQTLTQRCSSSVQVFVRLLDVNFQSTTLTSNSQVVRANYTVQILPTVLQEVFYELCGLTLKTIFDLRIPGATLPIKSLLSLLGGSFNGPACPSMNATSTTISQGFSCTKGEILRLSEEKVELPECVPCGRGTAFVNNTCVACPAGSFQDREGQMECRACPEGTHTDGDGAQSKSQCLAVCGYGMYSESGLIPCRLCPRHTFSGAPIPGGFKQCESCPENMFTANLGSTSQSQCKKPCREGHFSATGLEPCSACPVNYYQSSLGQQRCIECPNNTITHESGRSLETECRVLDCTGVKCQNKGTCTVDNHQVICECRPGFQGRYCEEQVPLCNTKPCLNGGTCETAAGTFRCICPQTRCQFGPDECIGVKCPNGGVCQDLPGLGTTKCICRSGFTGVDCSEISDPCQSDNPCKNGADCVPLQLGRYKCKCLPGWEGENCERNKGGEKYLATTEKVHLANDNEKPENR
ncbi:Sushi, von Willebrand factor type A, EGF and pentraxin domain-containing protein 1 [Aphelenchoides besseyi]|nr:Sushi, von Willebrand factor type A, EGF and pentraxin domain-containing protein 1 [Aphelenchoides besseyi]